MSRTIAFMCPDVLTLLAACGKYPAGFVGVGRAPNNVYCCKRVATDNKSLSALVVSYNRQSRQSQFFLLMPTADVACALRWDMADPRCQACGLPVRDH